MPTMRSRFPYDQASRGWSQQMEQNEAQEEEHGCKEDKHKGPIQHTDIHSYKT